MRPSLAPQPALKVRIERLPKKLPSGVGAKGKPRPRGTPFAPGVSGNPKGRPKGSKGNGRTVGMLMEARRQAIARSGLTPLEFLLSVMRDPGMHMDYRVEAAAKVMPYVHRKMPIAVEGGDPNRPVIFEAAALAGLLPQEKVMLLTLVEKMATTMQATTPKALIEGIVKQEAETDDADHDDEEKEEKQSEDAERENA